MTDVVRYSPQGLVIARRASFMLTGPQMIDHSKTETRRLNWHWCRAGMVLRGVHKCQGIRPGEIVPIYGLIHVLSVRREPLHAITQDGVIAEGFPNLRPSEFVGMFCSHMHCESWTEITVICFEHVSEAYGASLLRRRHEEKITERKAKRIAA